MEKQTYEAPLVEIIEVEVEKGFATSTGTETPVVGGNGENIPWG